MAFNMSTEKKATETPTNFKPSPNRKTNNLDTLERLLDNMNAETKAGYLA
jgi:hypothetical protein